MNLKRILLVVIIIFLLLILYFKIGKNGHNWQFFVEKNIGSKSVLQNGSNLYFDKDNLYFSDQQNTVYALNKKNGREKWTFKGQGYVPFKINMINNEAYLASFDAHIYRLDKSNGYPVWSYAIPEQVVPDTEVVGDEDDGSVFFADRAGVLYALAKDNGNLIWKRKFKSPEIDEKNPIHFGFISQDNNFLYIKNYPQKEVVILKKKDGQEVSKISNYSPNQIPIYIFEKLVVIAKSPEEYVAITKDDFRVKWSVKGKFNPLTSEISFDKKDNAHFYLIENDKLAKMDTETGKKEWERKIETQGKIYPDNSIGDTILLEDKDPLKLGNNITMLNKENGGVVWKREIPSSVEDLITQDNKIILTDITNDVIIINTANGEVLKDIKTSGLALRILSFGNKIVLVIIDPGKKAIIHCFDLQSLDTFWEYESEITIDPMEIYRDGERLYFLNKEKFIIESLRIDGKPPKLVNKINYNFIENFSIDVPKVEYKYKKEGIIDGLKKLKQKYLYILDNLSNLFKIELKQEQLNENEYEIVINHDQNLYNNYFTDIEIESTFTNSNNEKITIKGFYYDFNTWKVKFVSYQKTTWKWNVKVKTPYFKTLRHGTFITEPGKSFERLSIKGDNFVINDDQIFFPIGVQDCITDRNYDGNILNQMGYAKNPTPAVNEENFEYLPFSDYLTLYKNEAGLNMYRIGIDNCGPSLLREFAPDNFSINLNDAKNVDEMINELVSRKYRIIMTIFGFYPPYQQKSNYSNFQLRKSLLRYLDYVIARYGQYIDIWEISNEASTPIEWQNFISDYIYRKDYYKHPITTSWEQKQLKNSDLISIHWYSPVRTNNLSLEKEFNYIKEKHNGWGKAVLISEFGFKKTSFSEDTANSMRILTWLSVFDNKGIIYWNQPYGINTSEDNANIYLGPRERKYLLNIQNFLPSTDAPLKKNRLIFDQGSIHLYLLENDQYLLGYLLNQKEYPQYNKNITLEIKQEGFLEWYDPESGKIIQSYNVSPGIQNLVIPKISKDLVAKIKYQPDAN